MAAAIWRQRRLLRGLLLGIASACVLPVACAGSSINIFSGDFAVGASGSVIAATGDQYLVGGDFLNTSTQTATWNTSGAILGFQGGVAHQLSVAGGVGQFGWGTLQVNGADAVSINGNSATAASTINNGVLSQIAGATSLGAISGSGSFSIGNSAGAAAASSTVASLDQSSLAINSTGALLVTHNSSPTVSNISALSIQPGGQLDLSNNVLMIHYTPGADPLSTILGYLDSGYDGGRWDRPGIISSAAAANPNHKTAVGIADSADNIVKGLPPDTIELKYTLLGDANLDGVVNSADLQSLLASFNTSSRIWDQGDFNFSGNVNSADLQALLSTFNTGLGSQTAVPEPLTTLASMMIGFTLLCVRSRRI